MTVMTAKVSQKGQVVIPAAIRKAQNITTGTKLSFTLPQRIVFKKPPLGKLTTNDMIRLFEFIKNR